MGRNKIKIETKDAYDKTATHDKRKMCLLKKAKELFVLYDVPLLLLFSSPRDENSYNFFLGEQSYIFWSQFFYTNINCMDYPIISCCYMLFLNIGNHKGQKIEL
jgi:SRF-type transcription factor (DNA-binding and dimerisation domain)